METRLESLLIYHFTESSTYGQEGIPMYKLFDLKLQLFAEGGGDGGTGAEGATGVSEAAAVPQTKGVKNNPLANVQYGKQAEEAAPAAEVAEKAVPAVDRNAEFEKLIKGEYKDLYDQRMQDTIRKRLKGNEDIVNKYNELSPTIEMLFSKYGVKDIAGLNKAIEDDDSYYESEAMEKGMTVEQLKEFKRMQKDNENLRKVVSEREKQEKASQQYGEWMRQADDTKNVYAAFNLQTELQNQKFVDLLNSGIDVRTAYEVIHKDEIIPAAMQFAATKVEEQLTNKILSNSKRPSEGGMKSGSAAVIKSDVSQLSKADREEIIRRVQRGEKIRF